MRLLRVWFHCLLRIFRPGHRICDMGYYTNEHVCGKWTLWFCECETEAINRGLIVTGNWNPSRGEEKEGEG